MRHSTTIQDGYAGGEPSRGREDVGEGTEELVQEATTTEQPVGEAPTAKQHMPVAERPPEGGLAEMEMEMRLRRYIDKSKVQIIHHFEEPLADLN